MGSERLPDEECRGDTSHETGLEENGHCSGFPTPGVFQSGGFLLGGACRAAVFRSPFPAVG